MLRSLDVARIPGRYVPWFSLPQRIGVCKYLGALADVLGNLPKMEHGEEQTRYELLGSTRDQMAAFTSVTCECSFTPSEGVVSMTIG